MIKNEGGGERHTHTHAHTHALKDPELRRERDLAVDAAVEELGKGSCGISPAVK